MAPTLPIKTTVLDIEKLIDFLGSKPGWVELASVKDNLAASGDARKINTLSYLGIVERDGTNVKLTTSGRAISKASGDQRAPLFADQMATAPLYKSTLDKIHWKEMEKPTKVDIAAMWLDGAPGAEGQPEGLVTDGVITFFRIAELAGLGKFVTAGGRRKAHLVVDRERLAEFATGQAQEADEAGVTEVEQPSTPPVTSGAGSQINLDPGVRINVEIHIAADATPETIEDTFKNLRKYVLNDPESQPETS